MNKCLKISLSVSPTADFLHSFVQHHARKLTVEGTVHLDDEEDIVRIVVCGTKENVDAFLDLLHKGSTKYSVEGVAVEPFLKGKDYRGVFRVIE